MDERKTYYVAVGAGSILEDREAAAFEFEIQANEEELNKLQEMFEELSSADEAAAFRFPVPPVTASEQERNAEYDHQLHSIYQLLYETGTEETKRHIESIGILKTTPERECLQKPC
ncbi:hypothetical protein E5161_13815 [Cohnella pontilimi]|uniref:Hydrolase n=1 Tax=Cohnella pontilimi TaxID=2564100 RepID=A0A4U0FBC0_9BACL|nr:hypothetical protein [Cohnella pontilimi]TJY41474.1 hypothetical protein E5161_13815 [Cohnella pontilimi]